MSAPLGLGTYSVYLGQRGGQAALGKALVKSSLRFTRTVDDVTEATVTVPGDRFDRDPQPWDDEIRIDRDTTPNVWVGPLVAPGLKAGEVTLTARDVFAWFDHRRIPSDAYFVDEDAAAIFQAIAVDALHPDTSPNITIVPSTVGLRLTARTREIERELAGDRLRQLAAGPLDFVTIGRRILVGPRGVGARPDEVLFVDDAFIDPSATRDGLGYASELFVRGAGVINAQAEVPSPSSGQVTTIVSDDTQISLAAATMNAELRLDVASDRQWTVAGALGPKAPVSFEDLVPGLRCYVALDSLPLLVRLHGVLTTVTVEVDADGKETVGVVIEPVSKTVEPAELEGIVGAQGQALRALQSNAQITQPADAVNPALTYAVQSVDGAWQLDPLTIPDSSTPGVSATIPPFTQSGAVLLSRSPRWYYQAIDGVTDPIPITGVEISLQTAATSTTVVRVRLNAGAADDYTLPAGVNDQTFLPVNVVAMVVGDYIDVAVVSGATGATDLDVQFVR